MVDEPDLQTLELAPLPREQVGPFLLLGVEKDADAVQIEAAWARRVVAARKHRSAVPLEDVNWAREVLADPARRARADAGSLNVDLAAGTLRRLEERFGTAGPAPPWQPEEERDALRTYEPPGIVPTVEEARAAVVLPPPPDESPAVPGLLVQLVRDLPDPWAEDLLKESPRA